MVKEIDSVPVVCFGDKIEDNLLNQYYNVRFSKDFGKFKSGEKAEMITIDFMSGTVKSYDKSGKKMIKKQKFVATAI
jgi:hypothetical protein